MIDNVKWRKSSRSINNDNCVELAADAASGAVRYIRDSKLGNGSPVLAFPEAALATFFVGVKAGKFDGA